VLMIFINRLNDTQKYFGYLPIDVEIDTRKVRFLSQLSTFKIVLFVCYSN